MSREGAKIRVSVTMTKTYVDALDRLVRDGVYLSRGEAILEALRMLLGAYGMAPFYPGGFEALDVDR